MKLPYKVMSSAALSVIIASIPVIAHAQTGDFYNQTKQLKYSQASLRSDKTLAAKLQSEMTNGDTVIKEISTGKYINYATANDAFIQAITANPTDVSGALTQAVTAGATTATSDELDGYTDAEGTTALAVSSVSAISNTRIAVELSTAFDGTVDTNTVTIKDASNTAVSVSAAKLTTDKMTVVVDTATMTPGASYKATINGTDYSFVAKPADPTKPSVKSVQALSNTSVRVTLNDTDVDKDTALVAANYDIKDASGNALAVTGVNFGATKDIITLTTAPQTNATLYNIVLKNIKDNAGNAIDTTNTTAFAGVGADVTQPVVKSVEVKSNTKLEVTFTEVGTLNPTTALVAGNYTFDNGLTCTKAEFKKDSDGNVINTLGGEPIVVLTTSPQTAATLYTMTVQNVADATGNVITTATKQFAGVAADITAPKVQAGTTATSNTKVKVVFDDVLDTATALVAGNYTFDNGLTAKSVELDTTDITGKTVIVTTSAQTAGTLYKLTVAGVKNETGLAIVAGTSDTAYFAGIALDTTAPTITNVSPASNTSVTVVFNEKVTKSTAENVLNYSINNGLGYPSKATLADDGVTVTLTTASQSSLVYTLTVNNVANEAGLTIAANSTKTFGGQGTIATDVKLNSVVAMNASTIRVTFNQPVNDTQAKTISNYIVTSNRTGADADSTDIAYATTAGTSNLDDKFDDGTNIKIVAVGTDNKTYDIVFKTAIMKSGSVYTIVANTNIVGQYGQAASTTASDRTTSFAANTTAKSDLKVASVTSTIDNQIKVTFTEPVTSSGGNSIDETKFKVYSDSALTSLIGTGTTDGGADNLSTDGKTLTLTLTPNGSNKIESNKVYYLNVEDSNLVTDSSGLFSIIPETGTAAEKGFATGTVSASTGTAPKIVSAVQTDVNTLVVTFDQAVAKNALADDGADWNIYASASDAAAVTNGLLTNPEAVSATVDSTDNKKIIFKFNDSENLSGSTSGVYVFRLNDNTGIQSVVGSVNASTVEAERTVSFARTTTENAKAAINGVSVVAPGKMTISFSKALSADIKGDLRIKNKATGLILSDADTGVTITDTSTANAYDSYLVTLTNGVFATGTQYEVYVDNGSSITAADTIATVLKDDTSTTDVLEGSSTAAGNATAPTALTLTTAQFTLDFDDNDDADKISATTTAGLTASTNYWFKLNGTTAATVTLVQGTTQANNSLTEQNWGASVLGVGSETLTVSVYDTAGNLLGTTGNITTQDND